MDQHVKRRIVVIDSLHADRTIFPEDTLHLQKRDPGSLTAAGRNCQLYQNGSTYGRLSRSG
jgi:hypothetical protein